MTANISTGERTGPRSRDGATDLTAFASSGAVAELPVGSQRRERLSGRSTGLVLIDNPNTRKTPIDKFKQIGIYSDEHIGDFALLASALTSSRNLRKSKLEIFSELLVFY